MITANALSEPAKLLLLIALLSKDRIISNNGKAFVKELVLRRDSRLGPILRKFESKNSGDSSFLEQIHNLIQDEAQSFYEELFIDTSLEVGKTLSKEERDQKKMSKEKSLIYGEVEFNSFYRVLRKINPEPGTVFYDLGSGTGKAVFVARFTQDFAKCIGIEILCSLHNQATKIVTRYQSSFKDYLMVGQAQGASVYEGSFLDFDWSDGDVIFANSTCFDDDLMIQLSRMAERLKPGAIVVTFTKGMTNTPHTFELLERKRYKMSWGPATVFIHRRLKENGQPVGPPKLNILPSDSLSYDDEVLQQHEQQQTDVQSSSASKQNASNQTDDDLGEDDDEEEEEVDPADDDEDDNDEDGDEEEDSADIDETLEDLLADRDFYKYVYKQTDYSESPLQTSVRPSEKNHDEEYEYHKNTRDSVKANDGKKVPVSMGSPNRSTNGTAGSSNYESMGSTPISTPNAKSIKLSPSPNKSSTLKKDSTTRHYALHLTPTPTKESMAAKKDGSSNQKKFFTSPQDTSSPFATPGNPEEDFSMMNSPQDNALLMRKRSAAATAKRMAALNADNDE